MCQEDSPFFLAVKNRVEIGDSVWFHQKPLGKNSIANFMKGARKFLKDINKKVSNHSARKTSISNLLNNDIDPLHVQQISGHKRLESLNQHKSVSLSVQKKISHTLSGHDEFNLPTPTSFVPSSNDPIASIFSGANITNCTFQIRLSPRSTKRRVVEE